MAQPNLKVVQPGQTAAGAWPDANDASELLAIVEAQAVTIRDQAILIDRYQNALNDAQLNIASGTGNATGTTSLTLSNVVGTVAIGAVITNGGSVPAGATIVSQTSGLTGGNGVYVTSVALTLSNIPLTLTPPTAGVATGTGVGTGTSLAVSAVAGVIAINAKVAGAGVPASPPTTILSQQTGTTGGAGTYTTSQPTTVSNGPLAFTPPTLAPTWPVPQDAPTLNTLVQNQTAVTRTQAALIQHYQDVLNTSQTPIS
jgi:hypothetical protein